MIKLLESSTYKLIETKNNTKALMLDDRDVFFWKNYGCSGNLEYIKFDPSQICCLLNINNYRLYEVKNEPDLTSGMHLELYVGKSKWQSYLLKSGLPTIKKQKKPVSVTIETITKVRNIKRLASYKASSPKG